MTFLFEKKKLNKNLSHLFYSENTLILSNHLIVKQRHHLHVNKPFFHKLIFLYLMSVKNSVIISEVGWDIFPDCWSKILTFLCDWFLWEKFKSTSWYEPLRDPLLEMLEIIDVIEIGVSLSLHNLNITNKIVFCELNRVNL